MTKHLFKHSQLCIGLNKMVQCFQESLARGKRGHEIKMTAKITCSNNTQMGIHKMSTDHSSDHHYGCPSSVERLSECLGQPFGGILRKMLACWQTFWQHVHRRTWRCTWVRYGLKLGSGKHGWSLPLNSNQWSLILMC